MYDMMDVQVLLFGVAFIVFCIIIVSIIYFHGKDYDKNLERIERENEEYYQKMQSGKEL